MINLIFLLVGGFLIGTFENFFLELLGIIFIAIGVSTTTSSFLKRTKKKVIEDPLRKKAGKILNNAEKFLENIPNKLKPDEEYEIKWAK